MIMGNPTVYFYVPLPITLKEDGSGDVILRKGEIINGNFVMRESMSIAIPKEDMDVVLDAPGNPELSRRDDIVNEIYNYILAKGIIEGTIIG